MNDKMRHFFTGGNTWEGLHLFSDFITNQKTLNKKFFFKSKSMLLKSSLMENISEYFNKNGYDIECYHCPYDENLLDGIIIKKLNIALLNSSLLNVIDSQLSYEILDLEENLNKNNFEGYVEKENCINAEIKNISKRSYRFIKTAKLMQEDWEHYNKDAVDYSKLTATMEDLGSKILPDVSPGNQGKSSHLFATALTRNGIVSFIDTLYNDMDKVYVLNGDPGTGKTLVLRTLYEEAVKRGLYVEVYHHPLITDKIDHIIIPRLNTAVITSNEINKTQFNGIQIYMNNLIDYSKINKADVEEDKTNFYLFLNKSLSILSSNKKLQDNLEKCYFENIDSDALSITCEKFFSKIKKYEKNQKA
ncbi:PRK06851 family protein [Clostridium sp. JNZ X4-2]